MLYIKAIAVSVFCDGTIDDSVGRSMLGVAYKGVILIYDSFQGPNYLVASICLWNFHVINGEQ